MRFPKWFSHLIASRTTHPPDLCTLHAVYSLRASTGKRKQKRMQGGKWLRSRCACICVQGVRSSTELYMMGDDRNNNNKPHQRKDQNMRPYCGICRRSGRVCTHTVGSSILEAYLGISLENSIYSSISNANYATKCFMLRSAWKSNATTN